MRSRASCCYLWLSCFSPLPSRTVRAQGKPGTKFVSYGRACLSTPVTSIAKLTLTVGTPPFHLKAHIPTARAFGQPGVTPLRCKSTGFSPGKLASVNGAIMRFCFPCQTLVVRCGKVPSEKLPATYYPRFLGCMHCVTGRLF